MSDGAYIVCADQYDYETQLPELLRCITFELGTGIDTFFLFLSVSKVCVPLGMTRFVVAKSFHRLTVSNLQLPFHQTGSSCVLHADWFRHAHCRIHSSQEHPECPPMEPSRFVWRWHRLLGLWMGVRVRRGFSGWPRYFHR
jgi:hypothetical protein